MTSFLEIHLATFNGEKYLGVLVESLAEDDEDFVVRWRDDGSSDRTIELLRSYRERFGGRMILEGDCLPTGSAKGNFAQLLERSEADYVLWADQDDVWRPNKVKEVRRLLNTAEDRYGKAAPIYAFTDAVPTDAELNPIDDSYFHFKRLNPETATQLRRCMVCAPMPGCASGINAALRKLATPVPISEVTGHDWWAFALAAATGKLVHSSERTVLYRQHGGNVSMQQRNSIHSYAKSGGKRTRVRRGMKLRWQQARAVRDRLVSDHVEARRLIEDFCRIESLPPIQKRLALLRNGFIYPDATRTFAMLALC